MQEKTIKSIVSKKFNKWIESIDDENLKQKVKNGTVITGGCFPSLMQNEKPKDYDLYFKNKETAIEVAKYYAKKSGNPSIHIITNEDLVQQKEKFKIDNGIESGDEEDYDPDYKLFAESFKMDPDRVRIWIQSSGVVKVDEGIETEEDGFNDTDDILDGSNLLENKSDEQKELFRPLFFSSNAITLSDGIQLIIRFYGESDKVHETFDFVHTKAYWTSWENNLVIPKEVYEAVMNKVLIYTGSRYPVASIFRLRKFLARGWTINAGQLLKISFQISQLDLSNIAVLEDQLVGVDSSFFSSMIHSLKNMQDKKEGFSFGYDYIASIVDKIF